MSPSLTLTVNFRLTLLLGKRAAEIEDRDSIKLDKIIRVNIVWTIGQRKSVLMVVLSVPTQVSAQVMLIVGILLDRVEQRHFLLLVLSKVLDTVISLFIFEVHFIQNLLYLSPVSPVFSVKSCLKGLILHPLGSLGVQLVEESSFPGQGVTAVVSSGCERLFSNVLVIHLITQRCFGVKYHFVQLLTNVFESSFLVNFFDKPLSNGVPIVVEVKIVIHELNSGLDVVSIGGFVRFILVSTMGRKISWWVACLCPCRRQGWLFPAQQHLPPPQHHLFPRENLLRHLGSPSGNYWLTSHDGLEQSSWSST